VNVLENRILDFFKDLRYIELVPSKVEPKLAYLISMEYELKTEPKPFHVVIHPVINSA